MTRRTGKEGLHTRVLRTPATKKTRAAKNSEAVKEQIDPVDNFLNEIEVGVNSGRCSLRFALAKAMAEGISYACATAAEELAAVKTIRTVEQVKERVAEIKKLADRHDGEAVAEGIHALYRDVMHNHAYGGCLLSSAALECEKIDYRY